MKKQDLEAKLEDSSNRRWFTGKFGRLCAMTSLLFFALTGCAKDVEITGKLTKVDSMFVFNGPYKDEETGEFTSSSDSFCTLHINSGGTEYELNLFNTFGNLETCEKAVEAATGVQCCNEFRDQYLAIQDYEQTKPEKRKGEAPTPDLGPCKDIKCTYNLMISNAVEGKTYEVERAEIGSAFIRGRTMDIFGF